VRDTLETAALVLFVFVVGVAVCTWMGVSVGELIDGVFP
jgi:hypothetical protein